MAPLHSGKKKLLVFLKAQETGVRGESGGERGGRRAATLLSDISDQTERRNLTHSCKTARQQDYFFILFGLDYSLCDIFFTEILTPLHGASFYHHFEKQEYFPSVEEQRLRDAVL